jgi:hypothetical protein
MDEEVDVVVINVKGRGKVKVSIKALQQQTADSANGAIERGATSPRELNAESRSPVRGGGGSRSFSGAGALHLDGEMSIGLCASRPTGSPPALDLAPSIQDMCKHRAE